MSNPGLLCLYRRRQRSFLGRASRPPAQGARGWPPYQPSVSIMPPVMMMFISARGIKTFQPTSINWS